MRRDHDWGKPAEMIAADHGIKLAEFVGLQAAQP